MPADLLSLPSRRRLLTERRERADEVIDLCGLGGLRRVASGNLTIGQARMVEFARAIVDHPKVLLLDEPTSGLDDHEVERMGALLREIRARTGCGVVLVEHDIAFVMRECDRIAVLNLGSVIAVGTPSEIHENPLVVEAYLG
jgi:branched-chain amino acid transport system ATP-binding protein